MYCSLNRPSKKIIKQIIDKDTEKIIYHCPFLKFESFLISKQIINNVITKQIKPVTEAHIIETNNNMKNLGLLT